MSVDVSKAVARPTTPRVWGPKKWTVSHYGVSCVSFDTKAQAEVYLYDHLDGDGHISFGYPKTWG